MIEIGYDEFVKHFDRYFKDILNGKETIVVCKGDRRVVLVESTDYSILNSAIDIAKLILEK